MNWIKPLAFSMFIPVSILIIYILIVLYCTSPISNLSVEKAGQFGDSFGFLTCLFSGLAFSGALTAFFLQLDVYKTQRLELERSGNEHAQNIRLSALSSLLTIYCELAQKKTI